MNVPVLTAVCDPRWEAAAVAAVARSGSGVQVVRRCADLADLLAAAAAGLGRAAVVSGDLRRLDGDALTRLAAAGVAVVGLAPPGDESGERRLRRLGVAHVLPADAEPDEVVAAILAAVIAGPLGPGHAVGDPASALTVPLPATADTTEPAAGVQPPGRVVAVWGPTGAPGRTSVALGLAAELAELGVPALLVDADVYGGAAAQLLGLLDEAPGLAAACRLANNGTLDASGLAELAAAVRPDLRVLTGIARADRWPEVRPSGLEVVLGLCRELAHVTVVDCGFCLERDEELSFDTAAPRRNGATLTALAGADSIVAVASGDPVGLQRLVRGLGDLAEVLPGATPTTVVNRLRAAAVGGGRAEDEISAALARFAGVHDVRFVPLDVDAFDAAVATGRTLAEAAPTSPARVALQSLAADLAGLALPRRRSLRRRARI